MRYDEYVPIEQDARSIPLHSFIDQCNARILLRVIEEVDLSHKVRVLDVGAGTGQVCRLLLGLPNVEPHACDLSEVVQEYFRQHPELSAIPFLKSDFCTNKSKATYEVAIARGVLHHVPRADRPRFLKQLVTVAPVAVVADEGLADYTTEAERIALCNRWYQVVIERARQMGLPELVEMEHKFWKHERKATADDGLDFKEGEAQFRSYADAEEVVVRSFDRVGDWDQHGGGFYVAVLSPRST